MKNNQLGAPIKRDQTYSNYYSRKVNYMIDSYRKGLISEAMLEKYKISLKIKILQEQYDNIVEDNKKFLPYDPILEEIVENVKNE